MKIFGYMRVSVKDKQSSIRQLKTLKDYATKYRFKINEFFEDKISGTIKAENREQYLKLKGKLRNRDVLIITDLDRLGRDADDVITELKELKQIGIRVIALDMPYMNEWNKTTNDDMYNMIVDIIITIKAHMAEQERKKIVSRINQGLAAAKERGKKLGRPKAELSDNFIKEYEKFKSGVYGKMTSTVFAKMLNIGRSTLYKYINLYNNKYNI